MNKILTGDIHLSAYSNDKVKDGLPARLADIFLSLDQMVKYADANGINDIEIAGDVFNDKNILYTRPMALFVDFIDQNPHITFTIIPGNHDFDNVGKHQLSCVSSLYGLQNVNLIMEPKVVGNVTYMPYSRDIVANVKSAEPNNILISHFGLNEGMLATGISIIADIKRSDLKHFKTVLLGHYHLPQIIEGDPVVYYVGSPFQKDWNEKNQDKRFLVYDNDTMEVESVPLEGYTKHVEFIINDKDQAKEILKEATKLRKMGHEIKVRNETGEKIKTKSDINIIDEKDISVTDRGLNMAMSTDDILMKYMNIKKIKESDISEFLEAGKTLCVEVTMDEEKE